MYRMFGLMLFGVCVLSSGCASIINGTIQEVSVSSNPSGAKFVFTTTGAGQAGTQTHLKLLVRFLCSAGKLINFLSI